MAITFSQWIDQTFQSTLSVRRATVPAGLPSEGVIFQSTLSVRRATNPFLEFEFAAG